MATMRDYTGNRYGHLTVRGFHGYTNSKRKRILLSCVCDCGNDYIGRAESLVSGNTTSCGCQHNQPKHGHASSGENGNPSKTYNTWQTMVRRCVDPRYAPYPYYGGQGVTVCDRWRTFENFLSDMGERPEGMTLDRIDNTKGYSPDNCRWATNQQQYQNKRVVRDTSGKFTKE